VEVAKRRNFSVVTIEGHLSDAMEAGYLVDYRRGTDSTISLLNQVCSINSVYIFVWVVAIVHIQILFSSPAGLSEEKEEMITKVIRKEPICSGELDNFQY